jgi:hypothetical protein
VPVAPPDLRGRRRSAISRAHKFTA